MSNKTASNEIRTERNGIKENANTEIREYNLRKRMKQDSISSNTDKKSKPERKPLELETDPVVLQRKQKQIDYGKNTVGYHNYIQQIPKDQRRREHPRTPDKYVKYSRNVWDALIKKWRISLHSYDPRKEQEDGNSETTQNNEDNRDEDK